MAGRPEKYLVLREYLRKRASEFRNSGEACLDMTFEKIEDLGVELPPSAYGHREWWANTNAKPWRREKFETADVDMKQRALQFRYVGGYSPEGKARQDAEHRRKQENLLKNLESEEPSKISLFNRIRQNQVNALKKELNMSTDATPPPGMADAARVYKAEQKKCHPAFGSMKGLIRIVAGTDLTEPAADPKSWKPR